MGLQGIRYYEPSGNYEAVFSHEYSDGPSGPARSYWDVNHIVTTSRVDTFICLHSSAGEDRVRAQVLSILRALEVAHHKGKMDKLAEMRRVFGLKDQPHD